MSFAEKKVALVTGGGSGIGLGITQALLEAGAIGVTIFDACKEDANDSLINLKCSFGNRVLFVRGDVSNKAEFQGAFDRTYETFKNIDIVINNAGVGTDDWDKAMDINLGGVLTGTRLAMENYLPKYRSSDDAVIVNIASIAGLDVEPKFIPYTVTKHAVVGLGKALNHQDVFDQSGIRVLTVCPGAVDTPLFRLNAAALSGHVSVSTPQYIGKAVVALINDGKRGIWVIEDDQPYEVEYPSRRKLRKIQTS